jgi:hypothetical protein
MSSERAFHHGASARSFAHGERPGPEVKCTFFFGEAEETGLRGMEKIGALRLHITGRGVELLGLLHRDGVGRFRRENRKHEEATDPDDVRGCDGRRRRL